MTKTTPSLEKSMRAQFAEMRADLDQKHEENRAAWAFETRMTEVETTLRTIVGDNSGGSGLLHRIDEKVDALSSEVAGAKKVLVVLGALITIVIGILALIFHH